MSYAKQESQDDVKFQKKIFKALRNAAYCFGSGLGLMFVPAWFSHENENQQVVDAFNHIGYYLIGFAFILVVTFIFSRRHITHLNSLINFFGYPTVLTLFGLDIYDLVTA